MDCKKISEGLTRDNKNSPTLQNQHNINKTREKDHIFMVNIHPQTLQTNPWILFLKLPCGAFSIPDQALFIYKTEDSKKKKKFKTLKTKTLFRNKSSYEVLANEVTLLAMKSTTSSAFWATGLWEEILFQRDLRVGEEVEEDWGLWSGGGSMDLLKHHALCLIGKTSNRAFIVKLKMKAFRYEAER